jgi:hypothetical protein
MGMTDGGAGGTLGPAMVFGYLAGRDVGERLAAGADADSGAERGAGVGLYCCCVITLPPIASTSRMGSKNSAKYVIFPLRTVKRLT